MATASQPGAVALVTLYFAMLIMGMGHSVVFAVMPMLGRELALDQLVVSIPGLDWRWQPRELAITFLGAITALVFFFAAPYWGRRSDQLGRKRTQLTGMVGYSLATGVFCIFGFLGLEGLVSGFFLFVLLTLGRSITIFMMAAVQPAASAYVVDTSALENRTRDMSRLAAANQLGTMLGPGLAWFAAISFLAPFYLQVFTVLFAAILLWWLLPDINTSTAHGGHAARLKFSDGRFRSLLLMQGMIFTLLAMVQQTLGFYFQDKLHLPRVDAAQYYSIAMMCTAVATLFVQLAIVQYLKGSPVRLLRAGLPLAMVAFIVLANAASLPVLYAAMGILGLGMGLAGPGIAVTATYTVEANEQGALAGMLASVAGLGFVAGPLLGGYIYRFDITYPAWTAGVLLAPLALAAWRIRDRHGSKPLD